MSGRVRPKCLNTAVFMARHFLMYWWASTATLMPFRTAVEAGPDGVQM